MLVVTEAEAAAIRTTFEQRGELAASAELRRVFPGVADTAQARECARTIAGWSLLSRQLRPARLRPAKSGNQTPRQRTLSRFAKRERL